MSVRIFGAVALLSIVISLNAVISYELLFDRVEIEKPYIEGFYNVSMVRVAKFNRTTYVLNGEAETFIDVDEKFEIECSFAYSRLNNNQYSTLPLKLRRTKICDFLEKYKIVLGTYDLKEKTNIPLPKPDEKACPVKKVKQFSLNQFA